MVREDGEEQGRLLDVTTGTGSGSARFAGPLTTFEALPPSATTRSAVDSFVMRHFGDGDSFHSQEKGKGKDGDPESSRSSRETDSGEEQMQSSNAQSVHSLEGNRGPESMD